MHGGERALEARPAGGWRARPPHWLTLGVFFVLLATSLAAAGVTRHVADEQERSLLEQRAAEVSMTLSTLVTQVRSSLVTLVTAAQISNGDPEVFARAAGNLPGFSSTALVDRTFRDSFELSATAGTPVELDGPRAAALAEAVDTDQFVPTPVFPEDGARRLGFARAVAGSDRLVYAEVTLDDTQRRARSTRNGSFDELNGTLYAGPTADPAQVVLASGTSPPPGRQATRVIEAGTGTWLVAVSARSPLGGTLAQNTPWHFLGAGLVTAVAIAGLVELLLRRRRDAWVLVAERTGELRHAAVHDALTGLPNRTLLADRLEQALARQARGGRGVALLFLDVDRFKLLNDSRGHATGDRILVRVAERLRYVVRPSDTVARFGGDEFVVVCEDVDVATATGLAERITGVLEAPFLIEGAEVFLTVSVGISMAGADDTAGGLLRDADAAMYRAKDRGRSRIEFFDQEMRTEAGARLEVQNALHRALDRDELRLHYQPVVDLATGDVVGVEALLRWAHPEQGLLPPGLFIPMAEELGLIVPIGAWVMAEAAREWGRWREADPDGPPLVLSVNLSARQLREPGLVDSFRAIFAETGIDPACVCLELTETVLMEDVNVYLPPLRALKSLGVRLAVDDFGTGHASLTYLKRFPFDFLKIDRSFVRDLVTDPVDGAIVGSLIEMAHALGLQVVAEGIEDPQQLARLRALGCDLAQGYHFARPLPPEAIASLLARPPSEITLA